MAFQVLNHSVVLVTGGSRGIGAATAKHLAKLGYAVCVNYIANETAAHHVVSDIEKEGGKAIAVQLMFQMMMTLFAFLIHSLILWAQ